MFSQAELLIAFYAAGAILAVNLLAILLFVLYAKVPDGRLKAFLRKIIYELDRAADNMENADKKKAALQKLNDFLGWRRILVPSFLIGWLIDAEVAAIRKMQAATDTPDLHKEGE